MKNTNNIILGFDDNDIFNLVKFTYTFTSPGSPTSEEHIDINIDLLEALRKYFKKIKEPLVEKDDNLVSFIEFLASFEFYEFTEIINQIYDHENKKIDECLIHSAIILNNRLH